MYFLMNDRKELIRTGVKKTVYKYETSADNIVFLLPKTINGIDLSEMKCIVECYLPVYEDNNQKGLYKICSYDQDVLYEDKLSITLPITSAMTNIGDNTESGDIKLFLLFIKVNEENDAIADIVLKSGSAGFTIESNGSPDSATETTFDDIWYHTGLDDLGQQVETLLESKADGIDIDSGNIVLKSGETILNTIQLPEDVIWTEWK